MNTPLGDEIDRLNTLLKQLDRRKKDRRETFSGSLEKGAEDRGKGVDRRISPAIGEFAIQEAARLRKQIEMLTTALQFYANAANWKDHDVGGPEDAADFVCPIGEDVGDAARQALLKAEQIT